MGFSINWVTIELTIPNLRPNKIISGARTAANAATKHPDMRHSWV
jgi:hypothetical protein